MQVFYPFEMFLFKCVLKLLINSVFLFILLLVHIYVGYKVSHKICKILFYLFKLNLTRKIK